MMPRVRVGPETETERRLTSLTTGNRKSRLGLGLGLENRKNPRAPPSAAEVAVACVLRRLRDGGARGFFFGFLTLALTLVATFCFRLSVTSHEIVTDSRRIDRQPAVETATDSQWTLSKKKRGQPDGELAVEMVTDSLWTLRTRSSAIAE